MRSFQLSILLTSMLPTLAALLATLTGLIVRRLILLIGLAALAALLLAALLATLVLLISILVAHRRSFLTECPPEWETNLSRARSSFAEQIKCLAAPIFSASWCVAPCQRTFRFISPCSC